MTNLSKLAARIEAADASEQRALLIDAALEIAGGIWPIAKAGQFLRKLDAEAYESAALMLVPEGGNFVIMRAVDGLLYASVAFGHQTTAATPALALACAALRAKEVSDHG